MGLGIGLGIGSGQKRGSGQKGPGPPTVAARGSPVVPPPVSKRSSVFKMISQAVGKVSSRTVGSIKGGRGEGNKKEGGVNTGKGGTVPGSSGGSKESTKPIAGVSVGILLPPVLVFKSLILHPTSTSNGYEVLVEEVIVDCQILSQGSNIPSPSISTSTSTNPPTAIRSSSGGYSSQIPIGGGILGGGGGVVGGGGKQIITPNESSLPSLFPQEIFGGMLICITTPTLTELNR